MQVDAQVVLRLAMTAAREGRAEEALSQLRSIASPGATFAQQNQCARLARAIAPRLERLPTLRVAFLAGSTIDPLVDLLGLWLLLAGFRLEAYNAPFNSWRQQALDPESGLYAFRPDIVWFFLTARDLRFHDSAVAVVDGEAESSAHLRDLIGAVEQVSARLHGHVFVNNAEATSTRPLGNLEGRLLQTQAGQVSRYNATLTQALPPSCNLFDLAHQAACFGLSRWEDARLWFHSKHPFSLEAFGPVAFAAARLLAAGAGRSRKCVVLDLDGTIWGGVVGDDGPANLRLGASGGAIGEAFVAFQTYLKALSSRGVALAVCSKNDDALAREPFGLRSEMVLTLDDFAVFTANWGNKADNIRSIAATMNIGTDAIVFVDDNPAERALVRAELPEVAVVDLPDDPSDFVAALAAGAWFETLALSDEDRLRSRAYRNNAARTLAMGDSSDIGTYLRGLDMHATWGTADSTRLPRMSQLLNKTNQFQLTEKRYSQAELETMASDPRFWVSWFSLRDRFGDHGLISVVIVRMGPETPCIDAWAMSCRVFSRGMEDLVFAVLCREISRRGYASLLGRYVPSPKNGVVSALYERLGGEPDRASADARWHFDLGKPRQTANIFISEVPRDNAATPADTPTTN